MAHHVIPPPERVSPMRYLECEELIGQIWLTYDRKKIGKATHLPGSDDCCEGSEAVCIKAC